MDPIEIDYCIIEGKRHAALIVEVLPGPELLGLNIVVDDQGNTLKKDVLFRGIKVRNSQIIEKSYELAAVYLSPVPEKELKSHKSSQHVELVCKDSSCVFNIESNCIHRSPTILLRDNGKWNCWTKQ